MRPSDWCFLVAFIVGAVVVWWISATFGMSWFAWLAGLMATGSVYGSLVQVMGDASNADREWERKRRQ